LLISPYTKVNFIDHQITYQTSILRFIEDNWNLGRIGNRSFDEKAGLLTNMFDFTSNRHLADKLLLDTSTGLNVATTTATTSGIRRVHKTDSIAAFRSKETIDNDR
jgi:phospholipase C